MSFFKLVFFWWINSTFCDLRGGPKIMKNLPFYYLLLILHTPSVSKGVWKIKVSAPKTTQSSKILWENSGIVSEFSFFLFKVFLRTVHTLETKLEFCTHPEYRGMCAKLKFQLQSPPSLPKYSEKIHIFFSEYCNSSFSKSFWGLCML